MRKVEELENQIKSVKEKIRTLNQDVYKLEELKKKAEMEEEYPKGTIIRTYAGEHFSVVDIFPGYLTAHKISVTGNISKDVHTIWASSISGVVKE